MPECRHIRACWRIIENNNNLHIYPNPARSVITIDYKENERLHLSVYSMNGALILPGIIDKAANTIDISSLPEGIYLMELKGSRGMIGQEFIKK